MNWHSFCFSTVTYQYSNFANRWQVKIFIGVTKNPENIKNYLYEHLGQDGTLTEIGPFASRLDALNWLAYLKCRICNFQEITPRSQTGKAEDLWFGFTFEQPKIH
jgi:hypothetical protein